MSLARYEEADPLAIELFLGAVKDGVGELTAALAVYWTPRKLKALLRDPDFQALVDDAKLQRIESIEERLYRNATGGNQRAIEMVLYCQASDRGWRPPTQRTHIVQEGKIEIDVVSSTIAAAKQMLANGEVRALQAEIVDAEVVDGDA